MEYIQIILIGLAVLTFAALIVMTVILKRLVFKEEEPKETDKYAEINKSEEHIKDFFDINNKKESKVSSFTDDYEGEAQTTGVDFDKYYKESPSSPKSSKKIDLDTNREKSESYDDNEFKTISFEDEGFPEEPPQSPKSSEVYQSYSVKDNDYDVSNDDTLSMEEGLDETLSMEDDSDETRPMERVPSRPNVVISYKDGGKSRIVRMTSDRITVGRSPVSDLLLPKDSFAGRNHAVFSFFEGRLCLEDLNSKNGTYIGDKPVKGKIFIDKSCEVIFADTAVYVKIE